MIVHKKSAIVLVFNERGQLALQLRAAHDNSYPLHWDFTAGGGIDEGETAIVAAVRELKEEVGIDAAVEPVAETHCTYPAWKVPNTREVDLSIFKTLYDGEFNPDPNEVERVEFFDLDTIKSMVENGEKFHPEMLAAWNEGIIARAVGK